MVCRKIQNLLANGRQLFLSYATWKPIGCTIKFASFNAEFNQTHARALRPAVPSKKQRTQTLYDLLRKNQRRAHALYGLLHIFAEWLNVLFSHSMRQYIPICC